MTTDGMRRFRLIDRETDYSLPPSVQDWLPHSHLARYVVEGLDFSAIERAYAGRGSDAYHPALLLSLLGTWLPCRLGRWVRAGVDAPTRRGKTARDAAAAA